jgi:hypothetical protein
MTRKPRVKGKPGECATIPIDEKLVFLPLEDSQLLENKTNET